MHAKVQELLPTMRTDHLHTLKSITVTVNWSSLVKGLTDAGNIMTTGEPSMHFPLSISEGCH